MWISESATYRASSRDHDHPPLPAFLTCKGDLYKQSFAFHTSEGVGDCVTIDLGSKHHLSHIWIENRKEPDFYERAAGLSIWLSSKAGEKGEKVWTASKAGKDWDVPMDGRQARFITIGFPEAGLLHLAHAKVFGFGPSIDDDEPSDTAPEAG